MTRDKYTRVNAAWPVELAALTDAAATKATRLLFRKFAGEPLNRKIRIARGNRRTWIRGGIFVVGVGRGWKTFIHDLSHYIIWRVGGAPHHGTAHASIEYGMIEEAKFRGWLTPQTPVG